MGGVTPGKDGEHLGLPILPSVRAVSEKTLSLTPIVYHNLDYPRLITRQAKEHLKPDAAAVYVAAQQAASAIEEAIEAEIPLIVAVAEHIPLHDLLRVIKDSKVR